LCPICDRRILAARRRLPRKASAPKHGKTCEFHRYDGAGHGFVYWHRPLYRPEQAMDGWSKIFAFFGKHLGWRDPGIRGFGGA
jgi:dienelactone hydrolase